MSADDIRKELKERWAGTEPFALCLQIVDFVAKLPAEHSRMLTFKTMTNITGKKYVDDSLLAALNILASTRVAALDAHAMFVDDDNEEHEIEPQELALAQSTGKFIHPETGEEVPNYEEKVFPFFVPTDRFAVGK
ncbi:hypothetical protein [Mesorhizobium sp.]|uniref:hypothetical protein n=1 Tax=Mesorhizobium sp. TaxID=1871066 RepID=UPI000FEA75F3|nr:hypothetical protein [Mesorhizobium sp.]RWM27783.1 MAG: hypothetical protein EOR74_11400 [Mesorhizobium sp.]RWM39956.1 MAG: hypothetical protein EOR75_12315 [Mesorhizobium sp.]TJV53193.1 MAG: hypothetical protein E5Y01_08330 [Mesorhizobium sp.]